MSFVNIDNTYITKEQIDTIRKIIIAQADELSGMEKENRKKHPGLYDKDYMRGRNQYNGTSCILSGFRETTIIPGIKVKKISYGLNRMQPELESSTAIIQIYSSGAVFTTEEIKQKSRKAASVSKAFFIFQFYLNSNALLNKIDLVQLDGNANEVLRNTIYTRTPQMMRYPA